MTYVHGDERCGLGLRRSVEDGVSGRIGGQGESSHGVHDKVDLQRSVPPKTSQDGLTYPEKLNGLENRLHLIVIHGRNEREQDSGDVDGDLELDKSVRIKPQIHKTYL